MHEYKVLPAPARAVKKRGLRTTEDRFANTLAETLNAAAEEGWEFLRSETLPCTERKGFTGTRTTTQVVLIFRRSLGPAEPAEPAEPAPAPVWAETEALIAAESAPPARRAEPVFRPGAMSRAAGDRGEPPLRALPESEDERGDERGR